MLEKRLRICSVSNSVSDFDFDFDFSGLKQNMIFIKCIDIIDIDKISNKSDDSISRQY